MLQELLEKNQITQQALAEKLNVSQQAVSKWNTTKKQLCQEFFKNMEILYREAVPRKARLLYKI